VPPSRLPYGVRGKTGLIESEGGNMPIKTPAQSSSETSSEPKPPANLPTV